ncbi:MAG TPA: rod shape-determining protein MreD [Gemmatimonadales bacterium]|nr:rod shape-determining protein MreD [Gemmatimonadales bacterium]
MTDRATRYRFVLVLLLLVGQHFYLRPRLWDARIAPDFLMLALMLYAIRTRPGNAAVAGFLVGITADALTPARFGAGALAHTLVGYLAAWGRAVFFADNLLVHAGFIGAGVWLRNLVVLVSSGASARQVLVNLVTWSPLQALSTAVAGVIILIVFRDWLSIRLDE